MDPLSIADDTLIFPNACDVCKSTVNISRCSGCKLICYCGKDHQVQEWKDHKSFCKAVSKISKEKNLSHIFEDLLAQGLAVWMEKKDSVTQELENKLNRPLSLKEKTLLKFPRFCFTCGEVKEEKLKNCLKCAIVSFCDLHSSDNIHSEDCLIYKKLREFKAIQFKLNVDMELLQWHIQSIAQKTEIYLEDLPKSTVDFYERYTEIDPTISKEEIAFLNKFFRIALMLSNVLRTISDSVVPSELIIHVDINNEVPAMVLGHYWETILHLLPEVKTLKIVFVTFDKKKYKSFLTEVPLCEKCSSLMRILSVEANPVIYEEFMLQKDYRKPNLIAFLRNEDPDEDESCQKYEEAALKWEKVRCPMAVTFATDSGLNNLKKILETSSRRIQIIYDGPNKYRPLNCFKGSDDEFLFENCEYMLIFKPEEIKMVSKYGDDSRVKDVGDQEFRKDNVEGSEKLKDQVTSANSENLYNESKY